MISIIVGTSRKGRSSAVALQIKEMLAELNQESQVFPWDQVPSEAFLSPILYSYSQQHPTMLALQEKYFLNTDKVIYVIPEYNGSFPGELKLLIDALSVSKRDATFRNKKAAIVGVANGRAGNVRGLEDLTGVLHYLGTIVWPLKLPISAIATVMNTEQTHIIDEGTKKSLLNLLSDFATF